MVAVAHGHAPGRAAAFANAVGALVVSHPGAMPALVDEFAGLMQQHLTATGE